MSTINPTYHAVPVTFTVPQNGAVSISINDYTALLRYSKECTVGSGKTSMVYSIVHTTAGFVSLGITKQGAKAEWVADDFTITAKYVDDNGKYSFGLEVNRKNSVLPFRALVPKNIEAELFDAGIAISTQNRAHEALSQYLQWMLSKFPVQDANPVLGWKMRQDGLVWMPAVHDPPLLQYRNSVGSDFAYMETLNELMRDCPPVQFVVCAAAASTLLGFLRMTKQLPVETFEVSLKGDTSKGKTTMLKLAASLFSSPADEEVYSDFFGTENALIDALGRHYGVTLCYDELTVSGGVNKTDFVYTVAMGNSKKALDSQRRQRKRARWLCVALFSSEIDLIDYENDNLGLLARIIPLEGLTYTRSSEHADQIKTFTANNYGIIAKLLSKLLLACDPDVIMQMYNAAKAELGAAQGLCTCSLTERMISNHASIIVTGKLLTEIGLELDLTGITAISVAAMNRIAEYANRGQYLIQRIFGYISSNYHRLEGIEWDTNGNLEPISVSIEVGTFDAILNGIKYKDAKAALSQIDKTGCLMRQSEGRYKTRTTRDNVPYYSYRFDMNKVKEQFTGDFELNYSSIKQRQHWDRYTDNSLTVVDDSEAIVNGYNCKINGEGRTFEGKLFFL
ncbi:MAG: DUF927 domain-containing protein [Oscillospiraceae bacterium]|nr:DUF927 domain-containing protein [Oscillospiraceae bacterium]